jgi:peptidoglycan/LPS O-acetylase OafA/YrhL
MFGEPEIVTKDGIAAVLHYYNFYWAGCDKRHSCGPNRVYWTLSLEEQFYLILPFFLLLSRKYFVNILCIALVVQLIIPRPIGSMLNNIRTDGLIIGVLLAIAHYKGLMQRYEPKWMGNLCLRFITLSTIFLAASIFDRLSLSPTFPYARSGVTIVTSTLVWFASYNRGYIMSAGGIWQRFWMYLGSRSYVIYLVHIFAFCIAVEFLNAAWNNTAYLDIAISYPNTAMFVAVTLSTLMLTELVHRFIERPFMDH